MATRSSSGSRPARPPRASRAAPTPIAIDLALQGGGSHGAFTWGVLDRLLEDETLAFDGISGTSAGALNAAVLATGWAEGGRAGARAALSAFWHDVAGAGGCFGGNGPAAPGGGAGAGGGPGAVPAWALAANPWAPVWRFWLEQFTRTFSPYQFNPFDLNPLRAVAARHVRPAAIARAPMRLFITATAVRTGRPRVFEGAGVTLDALLASACLPQLFKAVEIDGQPYWDGGYSGNPALWPLIYETAALDLLLVKVNPLERPELPDTAPEIAERVNEITFNAGLVSEMRAIGFVQKLHREGRLDPGSYKNLRLHMVADEERLARYPSSTKLDTALPFLRELHALGRAAAEAWWQAHRADLGRRSSLDIAGAFLDPRERRTAAR
jgi:NTE family protein